MNASRALVLLLVGGCASAAQPKAEDRTSQLGGSPSALTQLEQQSREQATRVAELEARLGLLEQEARGFRERAPRKPIETVRIGRRVREAEDDEEPPRTTAVLRLHEELNNAPLVLPAPPAGVSQRLGVVPLPEDRASSAPKAEPAPADPREQYRIGLRLLQEHRWDESRAALSKLLDRHPKHELADKAIYWKGEAFYAERRYGEAFDQFRAVLDRHPSSNKLADALLKAGMCQKRLGASGEAARYFKRLRDQYPDSEAARTASREGSS